MNQKKEKLYTQKNFKDKNFHFPIQIHVWCRPYLQEYIGYWSFTSWKKKKEVKMAVEIIGSVILVTRFSKADVKTLSWFTVWQRGINYFEQGGRARALQPNLAHHSPLKVQIHRIPASPLVGTGSVAAFMPQGQKWVVAAETAWPAKPKLFGVWSFTEEMCRVLFRGVNCRESGPRGATRDRI